MVDDIHDFTVTDHQKNPLEELIIFVDRLSIEWNFWKHDCVNFFEVHPKHDF